ncbi:hypothetical protein ABIC83_002401 [Roseateles asaccharophilus]|uniref:hypothetical protein n=1 Tax=Roseateles asaccharophilus TaxID=582607 RepID=UPI003837E5AE
MKHLQAEQAQAGQNPSTDGSQWLDPQGQPLEQFFAGYFLGNLDHAEPPKD